MCSRQGRSPARRRSSKRLPPPTRLRLPPQRGPRRALQGSTPPAGSRTDTRAIPPRGPGAPTERCVSTRRRRPTSSSHAFPRPEAALSAPNAAKVNEERVARACAVWQGLAPRSAAAGPTAHRAKHARLSRRRWDLWVPARHPRPARRPAGTARRPPTAARRTATTIIVIDRHGAARSPPHERFVETWHFG